MTDLSHLNQNLKADRTRASSAKRKCLLKRCLHQKFGVIQPLDVSKEASYATAPPPVPPDIDRHMGQRVRARRIEAELTLDELAAFIDLPVAEVRAVEEGNRRLDPEDIVALCEVLKVEPSWFFEGLL